MIDFAAKVDHLASPKAHFSSGTCPVITAEFFDRKRNIFIDWSRYRYLSKNYSVLPIFLQRAYEQLRKANPERVSEPYRELVLHYLSHVAHFLVAYNCLGDDEGHLVQFMPRELLAITPSALPEEFIVPGKF